MRPERKHPLRTYSRRTQPETVPDAPTKRRKIEQSESDAARLPAGSDPPRLPELPKPEPAKRGSILSFFKPLNSSSSAATPCTTSDPTDPVSTPPSSPPVLAKARKRRRLTTRPGLETRDTSEGPGSAPDDPGGGEDNLSDRAVPAACGDARLSRSSLTDQAKDGIVERGPNLGPTKGEQIALRETKPGSLSAEEALTYTKDGSGTTKRRARWRANQAKVQTTLSLSLKDEPGFRICNDCGMLYNPLNEKDRKDHARRHAASLRKRNAGLPTGYHNGIQE